MNKLNSQKPKNEKEYHLYLNEGAISNLKYCKDFYYSLDKVNDMANEGVDEIHTCQLLSLSAQLFYQGYRIIVHPYYGPMFEIRHDDMVNGKKILSTTVLWRFVITGCFDTETIKCIKGDC